MNELACWLEDNGFDVTKVAILTARNSDGTIAGLEVHLPDGEEPNMPGEILFFSARDRTNKLGDKKGI